MAPFSMITFVKEQLAPLPDVEKVDLSERVVIVVGSNTGLGLEAARHYAHMNPAKLIMAVRSLEKGEKAKQSILESAPDATIEVWQLDLSVNKSIQDFATKANKELDRLDIALLNAGVANDFWSTASGFETTIQTNVIGTGLLALLLLPVLEKTAGLPAPTSMKPHLTIVASEVHFYAKFKAGKDEHPIHALNDKAQFDANDRYNTSKLLDVFITRDIAKVASSKVIVNSVNPGLCYSELGRENGYLMKAVLGLLRALLARTTEAGSRTFIWASTQETGTGVYSSACKVTEESDFSLSEEGRKQQAKVWADLKEIWLREVPELRERLGQ